jgi:hypothetical protein
MECISKNLLSGEVFFIEETHKAFTKKLCGNFGVPYKDAIAEREKICQVATKDGHLPIVERNRL